MISKEQIEQLYLWWKLFKNDGKDLCEIRCLDGQNTYSGYYHSIENIIRDITPLCDYPNMQFYFVLNPINEACYDRQQREKLERKPKNTTSDNDIEGRFFILLDLDPKRPSGVGSTDQELEYAHKKALQVYMYLKDQGFAQPIVTQSGNGWHLYYKVQLSKSQENTKLVERFLKTLSMLFSDENVEVDTSVHNLSRITKLVGTYAKKGANTAEHPWRLSKIVKYPEEITSTPKAYIEKVAYMFPDEAPKPSKENNFGRERFDVVDFLNRHGIEYKEVRTTLGTRYLLETCPFDSNHKHGEAMVFQHTNGALAFSCFHNGCSQYTWSDLRLLYEPDAYDKKDYHEFQHKRKYYETYQPKEVEIKEENEADGKKWLSFGDITRVRDEDLVAIPSGILALDRAIKGFILGEVSILSGINASGKTSFINTLLLNAVNKGFVSALWSGELQASRLKGWICQTAAGKTHTHKVIGSEFAYEADDDVIPQIDQWLNQKLFIYNNNYGSKWKQLMTDISECIDTLKAKFIVLDNLMAMSLDELAGDKNDKQKQLILELAELAKQKNVHILIVAHPRKEANNTLLRKESISGTSDLTNVVHNLFLIHRVTDDFEKRAVEFWGKDKTGKLMLYDNIIEVAKNRAYGVVDYTIGMNYEKETRRFKNSVSEYIHYGWEPDNGYETYSSVPQEAISPNEAFDDEETQSQDYYHDAQFRDDEPPF